MIELRPSTLREANAAIRAWHRHHKAVKGCLFSVAAWGGAS